MAGRDRYRSANFPKATGTFSACVKLDLAGDDEHQAARYGHGSAAHFGSRSDDRLSRQGPLWFERSVLQRRHRLGRSVALAVDGGPDSDFYDLPATTGLGMADLGGWGSSSKGADQYAVNRGLGVGTDTSVGAFLDLEGRDDSAPLFLPACGRSPGTAQSTNLPRKCRQPVHRPLTLAKAPCSLVAARATTGTHMTSTRRSHATGISLVAAVLYPASASHTVGAIGA